MNHTVWFFTAGGQDCTEARRTDLRVRQFHVTGFKATTY